jgi:hypothetical protein
MAAQDGRTVTISIDGRQVDDQLRLMAVHAHPDDESSKGAAAMAKYVADGVDVLVVTCTGGERGSVLNKNLDRPEIWANIAEIRRAEMDRAREILGVRQAWLGFVDSGLPEGDPLPPLPEGCFALADFDEAVGDCGVDEGVAAPVDADERVDVAGVIGSSFDCGFRRCGGLGCEGRREQERAERDMDQTLKEGLRGSLHCEHSLKVSGFGEDR